MADVVQLVCIFQHEVDFVRVGRVERIHADIKPYSAELLTKKYKSVAEVTQFYASKVSLTT